MIRCKFDRLRREKALRENRDISLRQIAQETGLAIATIQRLNRTNPERIYLSTLDTLCRYFGTAALSELLEYIPDDL